MLNSLRTVVMFCALIAGAPLAWPGSVPFEARPALFGALLLAAILSSVEPFIDAVRMLRRAPAHLAAGIFCPRCGAPMMEHVARHGRHAGLRFLRCARFPLCRGTRSARSHRSIE